jgi:hypothetical protein
MGGRIISACGLGDYETARQSYSELFLKRLDDPGP